MRPISVELDEQFIVTVFATPANHASLDRDEEEPERLGSFSYFAPPKVGSTTEFLFERRKIYDPRTARTTAPSNYKSISYR